MRTNSFQKRPQLFILHTVRIVVGCESRWVKTKFADPTDHAYFHSPFYGHSAYIASWPVLFPINLIHLVAMQAGNFFRDKNGARKAGRDVSTGYWIISNT